MINNSQKPGNCKYILDCKLITVTTFHKEKPVLQLEMPVIHRLLGKASLLRDGDKVHLQHTDQGRTLAPFYDQAIFKQEGNRAFPVSAMAAHRRQRTR